MKKLLLTFDDYIPNIPEQIVFHNTEDMLSWFRSKADIFYSINIEGEIISFKFKGCWSSFATFKYIHSEL